MAIHTEVTPAEAADRLAIRELFDAYAHCADRRDADGQKALFTDDTRFAVYLNGEGSEPSYVLDGREALTPVFNDLNQYQATPISTGKALSNSTATGPPARATRSRTTCSRPTASARSWSPHCATWTPSPRSTVPGISPSEISFSTGARPGRPLRRRCSPIIGLWLRRPAGAAAGRSRRWGWLA